MLASIPSATVLGVRGSPVTVEVFVGDGLPGYHMVGMPDTACRESRDRVRAAVISAGFGWPNRCITVNLAPTEPAQVRRRARPGDRRRRARRLRAAVRPRPSPVTPSSASSASTARSGGCPASPRWSTRSTTSPWSCRAATSSRRRSPPAGRCARRADLATAVACAVRVAAVGPARSGRRRRRAAAAARPRRRPRPAGRPAGAGDRRRRRPPPAARRVARAAARRCWPSASPACSRRSTGTRRWRRRWSTRRPGCDCRPAGSCASRRSGRRTTPPRSSGSSAAARTSCGPARSPSPTAACCSWTSSASSAGPRSTGCASRSRRASSGSPGRRSAPCMPARFLLVAATNPCPCGGGPPGLVRVRRRRPRCATCAGCRGRCSTASTCASSSSARPSTSCSASSRASRRRSCASGSSAPGQSPSPVRGKLNAALAPDELDAFAPLTTPARALLRDEIERDRLTGRGYHRVRRVARTIADLDGGGRRGDLGGRRRVGAADAGLVAATRPSGPTADRWIA